MALKSPLKSKIFTQFIFLPNINKSFSLNNSDVSCARNTGVHRLPSMETELLYIFKNWEMFLQLLDVNNPFELSFNYRGAETVIFTRRWRPSTFTLEPFVDTPLAEFNRTVLGRKLSEVSGLNEP